MDTPKYRQLPHFKIKRAGLTHRHHQTGTESRKYQAALWDFIERDNLQQGRVGATGIEPPTIPFTEGVPIGFIFPDSLYGQNVTITVLRLNQRPFDKPYRLKTDEGEYSIPMSAEDVLSLRSIERVEE